MSWVSINPKSVIGLWQIARLIRGRARFKANLTCPGAAENQKKGKPNFSKWTPDVSLQGDFDAAFTAGPYNSKGLPDGTRWKNNRLNLAGGAKK